MKAKDRTRQGQVSSKRAEETLGQRFSRIRKRRGFTQAGLSRDTGIAQNLISEYESGKKRMYADVLGKLAGAMGVSADEVLGLKPAAGEDASPPRLRILRRVEKLQALPPWSQTHILKTLDMLIETAQNRRKQ